VGGERVEEILVNLKIEHHVHAIAAAAEIFQIRVG